jgi:hypothetical protein
MAAPVCDGAVISSNNYLLLLHINIVEHRSYTALYMPWFMKSSLELKKEFVLIILTLEKNEASETETGVK